jgi:hypothetical protein
LKYPGQLHLVLLEEGEEGEKNYQKVKMKFSIGLVSLIASIAYAAPSNSALKRRSDAASEQPSKLQLIPVPNENRKAFGVGRNFAPTKNLDLAWKTPDEASIVSVNLLMQHPAVILEDIDDITAVDCMGQSRVAVTFSDKEAFDEALEDWTGLNDSFVMVTNHQGDCDTELERSFFVADTDTLAPFESNLTIIAKAEKSNVYGTAGKTGTSMRPPPKKKKGHAIPELPMSRVALTVSLRLD